MIPSAAVAPAVSQLPPVQRKHVANLVILKNLLAALPQAEAIVTPAMLELHYQSQTRKTAKKERHLRQSENEEGGIDAYTPSYEDDEDNDGGDEYSPPQIDKALLAALTSPDAIAFYASQISDNVFDVISSALELPPQSSFCSTTDAHNKSFSSTFYTLPAHPSRSSLTGGTAASSAVRHEEALNILTLVAAALYSQRCWTEICGVGAGMRHAATGMSTCSSATAVGAGGRPRVGGSAIKGLSSSFPAGHSFIPSPSMDIMTPEEIARRINKVISEDYVPLARVLIGTLAKLSAGGGGGLTSPTLSGTTTSSAGSGAPIIVTIHSNNSSVSAFPETLKSIRNSSVMNLGTKGTVLLIEAVSPQALPQQSTTMGNVGAAISSSSAAPGTGSGAPSATSTHISASSSSAEMEANFSKFFKDMWIAHGTAAKLRGVGVREQHGSNNAKRGSRRQGVVDSSGSPVETEEKKENGKEKGEESSNAGKGGAHTGEGNGSARSRAIEILDASTSSFAVTGALSPAVGSPSASFLEPFPNSNKKDDGESSHAATLLSTLAPPLADLLSILHNVQLKFKEHYCDVQRHRSQPDGDKDAHQVSVSACECALRVAMADWLTASMAAPSVAGSSAPTAPVGGAAAATTTSAATKAVCEFLLRAAVPTTLTNEVLRSLRASSEREGDHEDDNEGGVSNGKELFSSAKALSSFDMSFVASRIADEDQEVLERREAAAHHDDGSNSNNNNNNNNNNNDNNNNDLAFYSGSRLIKRCATFLFLQHYLNPEDFLPNAVMSAVMDIAEAEQRHLMQKMQREQEGGTRRKSNAASSAAHPLSSSSAASSKEASASNSSNQVYTSSGVAAAKRRRAENLAVIVEVKDDEEEDGEGDKEEQQVIRVAGQKHPQRSSTIGGGGSTNASSNAAANQRESALNLRRSSAAAIVPPSVHLACHFPHLHACNAFVSRVTVRSYFYLARCSSAGSPLEGVASGGLHESGSNPMTIHAMVAKLLAGPCMAMLLGSDDCERFLLASGATSPSESASLKAAALAAAASSNDANKTAKSEKKTVVKSEAGDEQDAKSLRYSGPSAHLSKAEAYSRVCTRDFLLRLVNQFEACEGAAIFKDPVYPSTIMNHSGAQLGPYSMVIRTPVSLAMLRLCIMGGGGDGGFAGGKGLTESLKPTSPTSATPSGKAKAAFPIATLADLRKGLWLIAANCTLFNAPEGPFPEKSRVFVNLCCKIIDEAAAIMMTI